MIFTHLGRIVAFFALLMGVWYVAFGLMIAVGWVGPEEFVLARYFGKKTTGAVIDRGWYAILFAIALGILTEISFSVRKT
jgi:hypothetical protein